MSEKNETPALPGEVWRGMVDGIGYLGAVCMVEGDPEPRAWWWDGMWIRASNSAAAVLGAWALSLRVSLAAALRTADRMRHGTTIEGGDVCPNEMRAEKAEAEALSFQRACGCVDGATLSDALRNIKHILREGDGIIPSPCEGIPDAAKRVVKRAEKAEKLATAERAYRVAETRAEKATRAYQRKEVFDEGLFAAMQAAEEARDAAHAALIEAGGKP